MKDFWEEMKFVWWSFFDATGLWPDDTVGKAACAGFSAAVVCLLAHLCPFTVEAFVAALLAYGVSVLCYLIFISIVSGVLATVMCIHENTRYEAEQREKAAKDAMGEAAPARDAHPEQGRDGGQPGDSSGEDHHGVSNVG